MAIDYSLRWGQNQSAANKALVWSDAQIEKGWTGRIPRYQYDNNWLNDQCQKLFEIQRKGIPFWKSTDNIKKYGVVRGSNGYYIAKRDSIGVNPANDTDYSHFCPLEVYRYVTGEVIKVAVKTGELTRFTKNGWKVMDGTNGTVNMQNRYIEGSPDMSVPGNRNRKSPKFKFTASGTTSRNGGHTHTMFSAATKLNIGNLPPHTHYFTAYNWNDTGSGSRVRARIPWTYANAPSVLSLPWWQRAEEDGFGNSSWTVRNGESDSNPFDNPNDPYLLAQSSRYRTARAAHKGNKRVWQTTSFTVRRDPSTQLNQNDFEYAKGSNASHSHGSVTSTNNGSHTHTYTLNWEKTISPEPKYVDVIFLQFIGF